MSQRKIFILLAAILAFASTGCTDATPVSPTPAAPATPVKPSANYILRATDVIRADIYQEPDFHPEVSVSQEGDVVLPLVGKVHLAGKTLNEAQQFLTDRYQEFFKDPNLSLTVARYAERKVYLDGMVGRAGPVLFPAEEKLTLGRAISTAGGILARGERTDIKIKRIINGKETVITVDMDEVSAGKAPDIELLENDYIYVRDSRI